MPNLSGSGGRSTGVNYATAALFDRMYWTMYNVPHVKQGAATLALTYQANTGPGSGSLKRVAKNLYAL